MQGLIDGRLDAIAVYSTDQPFFYIQQDFPVTLLNPIQYGIDFYGDNLFTSEHELKNHPERVAAFRQASLKGWQYAMAHPNETLAVIGKYGSRRTPEHLGFEYSAMMKLIMPEFIEMGYMHEGRWRHIADTYVRLGRLKEDYSLDGFLYDPQPVGELQQLRRYLQAAAGVFAAGVAVIVVLLTFNRRLQREVKERKNAESQLRQSEQRLNQALDAGRMGVWNYELATAKLVWSPELFEILDMEPFEPSVERFSELVHPDDVGHVRAAFDAVIAQGKPFHAEFRIIGADGFYRWVSDYGQLQADMSGQPSVIVGIAQDITLRKAAELELERHRTRLEEIVQQRTAEFSSLFLALPDIYFRVDRQGLIMDFRAGKSSGLAGATASLIGKHLQDILPSEASRQLQFAMDAMTDGDPLRTVEYEVGLAGIQKHFEARLIPLHPDQVILVVRDISDRKQLEQARELALMEATRLARIKSEFLANMSHEIRTPLNGVLGMAQVGLRQSQGHEQARNAFEKIIDSGSLLLGVINDILDFSKLEAGKIKVERTSVALASLLEDTVALLRERAKQKGIELTLEKSANLPGSCLGDSLRLGQILMNLLSNAVKFTESGSVTLMASRAGDLLEFKVVDTGIGMTDEHLSRLFKPFEQADGTTTRQYGGTGLGLNITKRLVDIMGGDITVSSHVGTGSIFRVRLPYMPADLPGTDVGADGGDSVPQRLTGLRVLVAEDNHINQMVIEELLRHEGAEVTLVDHGRAAVDLIETKRNAFDVVLMDIQMPVMDGHEATRAILELAPGLPVIGQTAHAYGTEKDACFRSGMVGHVAKPIDPDQLVEVIQRCIGNRLPIRRLNVPLCPNGAFGRLPKKQRRPNRQPDHGGEGSANATLDATNGGDDLSGGYFAKAVNLFDECLASGVHGCSPVLMVETGSGIVSRCRCLRITSGQSSSSIGRARQAALSWISNLLNLSA